MCYDISLMACLHHGENANGWDFWKGLTVSVVPSFFFLLFAFELAQCLDFHFARIPTQLPRLILFVDLCFEVSELVWKNI